MHLTFKEQTDQSLSFRSNESSILKHSDTSNKKKEIEEIEKIVKHIKAKLLYFERISHPDILENAIEQNIKTKRFLKEYNAS